MRASRVLLLPLLAVFFAVPARGADPAVAEFKQRTKFHVSVIKGNVKDLVKLVKQELADAAALYADGGLLEDTMSAAIASVTAARDELEDGAFNTVVTLSQEGHQILLDASAETAGPDFVAGTGGLWDEALQDADAALGKADEQFRKAWAGFVKSLGKAAKAQDVQLDVRSQLPPHGDEFWSVVPPGGTELENLAEGLASGGRAPQVLIETRFVETNTSSRLMLGIRAETATVDLHLASTDADPTTFASLARDLSGIATGSFALDSLDHPQGFVLLHLDDGVLTSPVTTLSAPNLAEPNPAALPVLKTFGQDLKKEKKFLLSGMGGALKDLKALLGTHVAAVKSGAATPELALRTGFGNLRDAREALGIAWSGFAGVAGTASAALAFEGVDDSELPADFQPDVSGLAAKTFAGVQKAVAKRQAQAAAAFDGFVAKILAQADKDSAAVGATWLAGRGGGFNAPMVTGFNSPAAQPSGPSRIADGLVLLLQPAETEEFSLLITLQAAVAAFPAVSVSSTALPDGTTANLADLVVGTGGTTTEEIPLTVPPDLLGWRFAAGPSDTDQPSLMILARPQLVDADD
jgi:hypothetical protein